MGICLLLDKNGGTQLFIGEKVMKNWKIGHRLGLGFAAVLVLLVAVAAFGLQQVSRLNDRIVFLTSIDEGKLEALSKVQFAIGLRAIAARNLTLVTDAAEQKNDLALVGSSQQDIDAGMAALTKLMQDPATTQQERDMLEQLRKLEAQYLPVAVNIVKLATSQQTDAARASLVKDCMPILNRVITHVAQFNKMLRSNSEANVEQAEAAYDLAKWTMLGASLAALMLGGLIAWLLTRSISRPLAQAVSVAQSVQAGDLGSHIEVNSKDELGQLMAALKGMNESLVAIVGEVRHGTDTIAVASDEIKRGNMDLSNRTEQQASSLQETASAMEQLTATVKQTADNAREARRLADNASQVAAKGGAAVGRVVETMHSISASSHKIVDIISVIDGIAFQTNILALNAAVEAARAGEQGRGFAVVASEVRTLAQRSASAAKEIKALIDDSVARVDNGSRLVEQAGSTMSEVVASVRRVTDVVAEISAASHEQSDGIEQINQAIVQMDEVTQQNAALVEQAAAAAQSLQEQSVRLSETVGVFKLSSNDAPRAQATRKPLAPRPATTARPAAKTGQAAAPAATSPAAATAATATPPALPAASTKASNKASAKASAKAGSKAVTADDGDWEQF